MPRKYMSTRGINPDDFAASMRPGRMPRKYGEAFMKAAAMVSLQ